MNEMKLSWLGGMRFYSRTPSGHDVFLDSSPKVGGTDTAARPMEHLLIALMGCTGMDVVSILEKMRVDGYTFDLVCEYERAEDHPKVYTKINLKYVFKGENLPKDKLEKAVKLSQEKYCSVSAMLKKAVDLTYEIVVEE
ncbi:MAG: putative redox protein [Thermotogota bacterium]|nr:putative redox protein [Thermotogota bacterium]MDK2864369.1 putative redox protein [Thermotogota bacterium]